MWDLVCIFSALFFFTSNILGIVDRVKYGNRSHFDVDLWRVLDSEYLQEEWDFRRSMQAMSTAAGVLNAFAWFTFSIPVLQAAWILSRGGKRMVGVHAAVVALALAGSYTELIARMLIIGLFNASEWLAFGFNMDNWLGGQDADGLGWKALEVTHLVTNGLIIWVDALEWLALFGILTLLYYSVGTMANPPLGKWWARWGLLIALLCFVDFAADVLRYDDWSTFSRFAVFVSLVNMVLMLPIWLLMLARQLPKAKPKYVEEEDNFLGHDGTIVN